MTRYRLLFNGDHWSIQKRSSLWPFWQWVFEWENQARFATDIEARKYVDILTLEEETRDKRNAPYTLRVYL